MIKKYGDIFAGVFFLALTCVYYQATFMELKFRLAKYGAEFVPRIYCIAMAAVSVGIIVRALFRLRTMGAVRFAPSAPAIARVAATIACVALYFALMPRLGFLLATAGYLVVQVMVLAPRKRVRIVGTLVFAAAVSAFLNLLFVRVFTLPLPTGILSF